MRSTRPLLAIPALLILSAYVTALLSCTLPDSDGLCRTGQSWWSCHYIIQPPDICGCQPYSGTAWQCWTRGDKAGADADARRQIVTVASGNPFTVDCTDSGSTKLPGPQTFDGAADVGAGGPPPGNGDPCAGLCGP